jgi:replicative DNA helicase
LLGAVLLDNAKLTQVTHLLSAVRFADPIHGVIYSSICKAVDAGQTANVALLLAEFEGTGALDEVGGTTYLGKLVDQGNLQKVDARFYAESIHDAWLRRELITAGERLHALAEDVIQGAYGESVSDFGEASGVDQAGYVASRLRGLLSSVEAAMGTPA